MGVESEKAFLAFSLGPVQPFIAAARTVRDLWTGSYLLARLTRAAMQPILTRLGQDAFVSPAVIGNEQDNRHLRSPCLPNRFLAEVPLADAESLAQECEAACRAVWQETAREVYEKLGELIGKRLGGHKPLWESQRPLWDAQVESFFDIRKVVLPWKDCPPGVLARLLGHPCEEGSDSDRQWSDRVDLLGRVLAAQKAVRHIPDYRPPTDPQGRYPAKCSLLGTYEQMGPADLGQSAEFWREFASEIHWGGTHTRKQERLCAVSLVKRFAWPVKLADEVQARPRAMRFEDTATVAATQWLEAQPDKGAPELDPAHVRNRSQRPWSGQWLHWSRPDADDEQETRCPDEVWDIIQDKRRRQGKAPTYYAILMLDGDHMGDILRAVPGPKHQLQVSRALSNFAKELVCPIVENQNDGTLIYSGGDDVLALLPTLTALKCAVGVKDAFVSNWQSYLHGLPATVSAGLAVVHYKEDLRSALNTARRAEKRAKESGRNTLVLTVCRRSGEHTSALCPWEFVTSVAAWVRAFLPQDGLPGASDRWSYHLYGELPTLSGLVPEAMRAEISRQVNRAEEATRLRLRGKNADAGGILASQFDNYLELVAQRGLAAAAAVTGFVTLCQTASFLARGRDE
ncbi:MAG: type III-B CRISPR-associated protein Cas10/Cmr2 [Candidatus Anammoximicrobium sp.]|nr:type III-B CRISPR-associated protein Cas10/Cmr2 [Candidatus Anammoximicrobium sp.]